MCMAGAQLYVAVNSNYVNLLWLHQTMLQGALYTDFQGAVVS